MCHCQSCVSLNLVCHSILPHSSPVTQFCVSLNLVCHCQSCVSLNPAALITCHSILCVTKFCVSLTILCVTQSCRTHHLPLNFVCHCQSCVSLNLVCHSILPHSSPVTHFFVNWQWDQIGGWRSMRMPTMALNRVLLLRTPPSSRA